MRLRKFILIVAPIVALLAFADPALAVTHGGEGLYGPTNDVSITNMMFALLGFFPLLIIVMSTWQAFAEKRRHKKLHARRAAEGASQADTSGW